MHPITADWLPDVVGYPVMVAPDDINGEAQKNKWSFSVSDDGASSLTENDLEIFLMKIIAARREALTRQGLRPGAMTFYCWFDEMASHLCFSLGSVQPNNLPFRRAVEQAPLTRILALFLHSGSHDGIPWRELRPTDGTEPEAPRPPLHVWSLPVP